MIDFGAVKEITVLTTYQKGTTTFTVAVGTPGYMPGEQSNGQPKLSSDIYAVGMVGIKALTGKEPHNLQKDSKTGNVIWRNEAQVSNRLANILDKMVHEYFPMRYENATAVLEALDFTTSPHTTQPTQVPKVSQIKTVVVNPPPPPNKSRRQILILGGLAGTGFVAAILSRGFGNKPSSENIPTSRPNIPTSQAIPETTPENIPTSQPIPETPPENISPPQPTPAPPPPPRPKFSIQTFTTVTVNRRGEIISRRQHQAEVMTENLGNGVSLEMVKIPGGRFLMGSPETEAERRDSESPQHNVDVPEFFMGKYPVTQAQWEAVMGNNPSKFKGANRPVEKVSWKNATEFCQKLSEITGKKYSLPSESQWEYARPCRNNYTFLFWGNYNV